MCTFPRSDHLSCIMRIFPSLFHPDEQCRVIVGILTKTAAGRERVGGDDDFSQFVIRLEDATFDTLFRDSCWEGVGELLCHGCCRSLTSEDLSNSGRRPSQTYERFYNLTVPLGTLIRPNTTLGLKYSLYWQILVGAKTNVNLLVVFFENRHHHASPFSVGEAKQHNCHED